MKKEYLNPEAEWIRFAETSIITTSGDEDEELGGGNEGSVPGTKWD